MIAKGMLLLDLFIGHFASKLAINHSATYMAIWGLGVSRDVAWLSGIGSGNFVTKS